MPDQVCIVDASCQIAAMEPLCGASFAIGLAYLALDRFRYRALIRKSAAKHLTPQACLTDGIHDTTAFKTLAWLAGPDAPQECLPKQGKAAPRPDGLAPFWYNALFSKPVDEILVSVSAIFAFFVLVAGVSTNVGAASWPVDFISSLFSPGIVILGLVAGTCLPVFFVLLGRHCVTWSDRLSGAMGVELTNTAKRMQIAAQELPNPDINPN